MEQNLYKQLIPNIKLTPFSDILINGTKNGLYKSKEFHGHGTKIINMGELFGNSRLFDIEMKRIKLTGSEIDNFSVMEGDLLFARRSLTAEGAGKCSIVMEINEQTVFESSIIRARLDKKVANPLYLYYFFNSRYGIHLLRSIRRQVAVAGITSKDLQELLIPLPSLSEQNKIVEILDTLDRKIELNRQMNQTLEAMARTIFKSWFVDFDPVYAKMEGRDYPLPPEIMDLFPDELEESKSGLIPKGWKATPFGNLIKFHIGGDWGKESATIDHRSATRIVRGTDIPELHNLSLGKVPIRYIKPESLQKRNIEPGDIIIEVSGGSNDQPTGRSLFFTQSLLNRFTLPIAPTSFCRLLKPINIMVAPLLSLHLRIIYDKGLMWNYQNRSTGISNFQTKHFLNNELVVLPSYDVLEKFFQIVYPILISMQSNENISLQKIRDSLLPKFINGEIEVLEGK